MYGSEIYVKFTNRIIWQNHCVQNRGLLLQHFREYVNQKMMDFTCQRVRMYNKIMNTDSFSAEFNNQ